MLLAEGDHALAAQEIRTAIRDWREVAAPYEVARGRALLASALRAMDDGFFVAFDSARRGIDCAIAIQRTLVEHRRTSGFAPSVRIGLHAAEANRRGDDYSGMVVHVAARVAALAGGAYNSNRLIHLILTHGGSVRVRSVGRATGPCGGVRRGSRTLLN